VSHVFLERKVLLVDQKLLEHVQIEHVLDQGIAPHIFLALYPTRYREVRHQLGGLEDALLPLKQLLKALLLSESVVEGLACD